MQKEKLEHFAVKCIHKYIHSRPYIHQNFNKEPKIQILQQQLQCLKDYERFSAEEWGKTVKLEPLVELALF